MDRSVDSIGSCSLDVDADSTDFSDTSGELNFLTPNSAKDIQREFTAGIKERCKIPFISCQAVTTVLDPATGNISTVLTTTSPQTETATSTTTAATAATGKKPSYLNLACCVNGYSNLTTYDSKLRQDINKSREVSPSRPIIATLHYNRSEGGNFQLTAPTLSYISMNNSINNSISNGRIGAMVNGGGAGGRFVGSDRTVSQDVPDNAAMFNSNGFSGGGLRTKVISSQSQLGSVKECEKVVKKSFIQQRVEKLYGSAEGVVISKQIYNNNERRYLNNIANENVNKSYSGTIHFNGNGNAASNACCDVGGTGVGGGGGGIANGAGGGASVNGSCGGTKENLDENNKEITSDPDLEALPVLRHLRPEFRAQLQLFSPKKVPKTSPARSSSGSGTASSDCHIDSYSMSNGDLSHHHSYSTSHLINGKVTTSNSTTTASSSLSSSSSIHASSNGVDSREEHTTVATTVVTTATTTKTELAKSHEQQNGSDSESLSVVTSAGETTTATNTSDATGPTTVANDNSICGDIRRESFSPTTTAVTKRTPVGEEPICVESVSAPEQKQEMKLNELSSVALNGGDHDDRAKVIQNGTKNGHHNHHPAENKENLNGDIVEPLSAKSPLKDGNYFLQVLKNEQKRLYAMAADIESEIEQVKTDGVEISEEITGYILVAAGKARLLCSQKMKQFEGLCYNNLNQLPGEKFQTTNEDLRGFWDMVMLQVDNVDASFAEIDSFRRNGWKQPAPVSPSPQTRSNTSSTVRTSKLVKRPFKTPAVSSDSVDGGNTAASGKRAAAAAAAARRDAQRKQLMELKRKQKLASSQQNVEIFVPGAPIPAVSSETNDAAAAAALVDAS
ncbi:serine-rich adhesin for platelets-like [Toxorhynchites rutilus septentrionalis]|uniref:serine-rich adhesin for platelets-like n=1 Tax=Toxorhynchites rutilus septentrionalis TaxID=329112 RepID=UPI002479FA8E|nr:serine-rich adhesin for platelets-like [Toxorhynchites rutilus septentrionalis]XP_055636545.1 serine-rich adhesin for platelets-like [Toxorhynchites rutilus septentrionalis]